MGRGGKRLAGKGKKLGRPRKDALEKIARAVPDFQERTVEAVLGGKDLLEVFSGDILLEMIELALLSPNEVTRRLAGGKLLDKILADKKEIAGRIGVEAESWGDIVRAVEAGLRGGIKATNGHE